MMTLKGFLRRDRSSGTQINKPHSTKPAPNTYVRTCPVNTLLTQIFSGIAWNG